MRIYLPATLPMLRDTIASGTFRPVGGIGFAVTADLQAEYPGADTEDLEYVAMHDAALASLRLIAAGDMEPVRVVLAVDADSDDRNASSAGLITARGDLDRAAVMVAGSVAWDSVVSAHLDGGDVATVIRAAADAVTAADLGDMDAALAVGDAEDIDLAWYAASEIGYLVTELSSP